jgi:hypothetical protein
VGLDKVYCLVPGRQNIRAPASQPALDGIERVRSRAAMTVWCCQNYRPPCRCGGVFARRGYRQQQVVVAQRNAESSPRSMKRSTPVSPGPRLTRSPSRYRLSRLGRMKFIN